MLRQILKTLLSIRVGDKIIDSTPAAKNIGVVVDSVFLWNNR